MTAPRLTNQLLAWVLGSLFLLWCSFIVMAYRTGQHEADELTDGHLAGVASLLVNLRGGEFLAGTHSGPPLGGQELSAHDYQQSMTVAIWDSRGVLLTRTGEGPTPSFDLLEGFSTVNLGEPTTAWRTFARWNGTRERKVAVLLSLNERDALAQDIAENVIEPGFWLLPLLALVLGIAVRRGLKPLYELSREVHSLDIRKPRALSTVRRHEELRASVEAINSLVDRYQSSLTRERALADEFAHELRTPLTSLALQAQALKHGTSDPELRASLIRFEADVLRAGEVITHLLSLARASRTELAELSEPLDLSELARTTLADFSQVAHASGRDVGLDTPGPLMVKGHAALLAMAFIDNALRHSGEGGSVEVQVCPEASWIQVCDAACGSRRGNDATAIEHIGLGLGHRVVRMTAAIHGAKFEQVQPPPEGFSSCYRMTFPTIPAAQVAPQRQ
jgi:two-component system sensor histidine kinase QseC